MEGLDVLNCSNVFIASYFTNISKYSDINVQYRNFQVIKM